MRAHAKRILRVFVLASVIFGAWSFAARSAQANWWSCHPIEILEYSNKLSVRCSLTFTINGNILSWGEISNSNVGVSARFLALANAAILSGKIFWMDVPSSATNNVSGCLSTNCRTPTAWGIGN